MDIRMSAIKHWDVLDCYLLLSDWIDRQAQDKCYRLTKYSMTVSYYHPSTKRLAFQSIFFPRTSLLSK